MHSSLEILNRIFKPVQLLIVNADSFKLEDTLKHVCACAIDSTASKLKYDAVFVNAESASPELMRELRKLGPLVLVGAQRTNLADPAVIMPKVTEQAVADLFRMLKIKMRTPEVARLIAETQKTQQAAQWVRLAASASGESSAKLACAR